METCDFRFKHISWAFLNSIIAAVIRTVIGRRDLKRRRSRSDRLTINYIAPDNALAPE